MPFFKSAPNLSEDEKARIEFHLQQISESIGFDRLQLPVMNESDVLYDAEQSELRSSKQILNAVGEHLTYDISEIRLQTLPMPPEKTGGGG